MEFSHSRGGPSVRRSQLKRVIVGLFATFLVFVLGSNPVLASEPQYRLEDLPKYAEAVRDLGARGILTPKVADEQVEYYAMQASSLRGKEVTPVMLRRWSAFQAVSTVQAWVTIIAAMVGVGGVLFFLRGLLGVIGEALLKLLLSIPMVVYQLALCVFGGWAMLVGNLFLSLVGAAAFYSGLWLDRWFDRDSFGGRAPEASSRVLVMLAGYAGCAYAHQSVALGVLAAVAFVQLFEFVFMATELSLFLGFSEDNRLASGTVAAGMLTIAGVVVSLGLLPREFAVYQTGALFCGALVFLLGLDILSSKWCAKSNYLGLQLLAIGSFLGLLWLGVSLDLGLLKGISGTLFAIYLLGKWTEFCSLWVKDGMAFGLALLVTAGALYGVSQFMAAHPELFLLDAGVIREALLQVAS